MFLASDDATNERSEIEWMWVVVSTDHFFQSWQTLSEFHHSRAGPATFSVAPGTHSEPKPLQRCEMMSSIPR